MVKAKMKINRRLEKMTMENKMIGEVSVPVGMTEEYFGAQEDNGLPEMGNAQMVASLVLSNFSIPQIKELMPAIKNVSSATITKMIVDTSSRAIRKDFILSLKGQMPRQLQVSEYVKVVGVVGQPKGKVQLGNLEKILTKIALDMQNVELIVQARKPKVASPQTREDVIKAMEKTERSIKRSDDKIRNLNKKVSSMKQTLEENPEDQLAAYNLKKAEFNLSDTDLMRARSMAKLEDLKEVLAKFDALV